MKQADIMISRGAVKDKRFKEKMEYVLLRSLEMHGFIRLHGRIRILMRTQKEYWRW